MKESTGLIRHGESTCEDAVKDEKSPNLKWMTRLVTQAKSYYEQYDLEDDIRNLSYYRGKFWAGDGVRGAAGKHANYASVQNEVFPIVNSMVSALAMDTPHVEALDRRVRRTAPPKREDDATFPGRSIAAVLNFWADLDRLGDTVRKAVLNACLFKKGGIIKTMWDASLGRPIWVVKEPWEVYFDPSAKRIEDVEWAFELFTLHIDDVEQRMEDGVYDKPEKRIKPTEYPRSIADHRMDAGEIQRLKQDGAQKYVALVEFWNFRTGEVHHLHLDTRQVLFTSEIPHGNPFGILTFHDGVGRLDGISDVSLIAEQQRIINELVSARSDIVRRLARRVIVDKGLFKSQSEWESFKNAKATEPVLVSPPASKTIHESIFVSPEVPTTFDFNTHLNQQTESVRWLSGLADFNRGQAKNIRTAAEANMIRAATEGRLTIRVQKVTQVITEMYQHALASWRWALKNPKASGIDMEKITYNTQADIEPDVLKREVLELSPKFRVLPFSPLMEDKIARRNNLMQLIQALINSPMAPYMDMEELAREITENFQIRPSVAKSKEKLKQDEQQAMQMAQAGGAQVMIPGLEPGT